jgi:hypothetical protein
MATIVLLDPLVNKTSFIEFNVDSLDAIAIAPKTAGIRATLLI